jgi:hypothetical protein
MSAKVLYSFKRRLINKEMKNMKRFVADLNRCNIPVFDGGIEEYNEVVNQVSQPTG